MNTDDQSEKLDKLRQAAGKAKQRAGQKLDEIWIWLLVRGVLACVLAIIALFWSQTTVGLLVKLLGGYLLVDGVVGAVAALRTPFRNGFPLYAVVSLVMGAVLLFWTGGSVKIVLMLVGAWALLQGGAMFFSSRNREVDDESGGLLGTVGAVLAIIGLILMVWPGTGVVAISWLIAAVSVVIGGAMIWVALRLRRITHRSSASTA